MLMKDIMEKEETQPHSMKAPELSANCAEAQRIKKRIAELQNRAHKLKVTEKFEKAYPEYALVLSRYSKSRIFAAKEYQGNKIKQPVTLLSESLLQQNLNQNIDPDITKVL